MTSATRFLALALVLAWAPGAASASDKLAGREDPEAPKIYDISLALSGGGYRAMLFHLGAIWRLHELGLLYELDEVSSVSGGSITAARLGYRWNQLLDEKRRPLADAFEKEVANPIMKLGGETLDWPSVLVGAALPIKVSTLVERRLDKRLFDGKALDALPEQPAFRINATNLQTGSQFVFTRQWQGDAILGCQKFSDEEGKPPHTRLAKAVAASAAFPPMLSPAVLKPPGTDEVWARGGNPGCFPNVWESDPRRRELERTLRDEDVEQMKRKIYLTDGGAYDNLGIAPLLSLSRDSTTRLLVSDGGGRLKRSPKKGWQLWRLKSILGNLPTDLRTEALISHYRKRASAGQPQGAFWSMRYEEWGEGTKSLARRLWPKSADPDNEAMAATRELATTRTALYGLKEPRRQQLVNFGYLAAEIALQSYYYDAASKRDNCKKKEPRLPYYCAGLGGEGGKPLDLGPLCAD